MKIRPVILAAALLLAGPAFAEGDASGKAAPPAPGFHGGPGKHHGGPFMMIDADHDGTITKEEWTAHFEKVDANHDGKITREEIMAMRPQKPEGAPSGGGEHSAPPPEKAPR